MLRRYIGHIAPEAAVARGFADLSLGLTLSVRASALFWCRSRRYIGHIAPEPAVARGFADISAAEGAP